MNGVRVNMRRAERIPVHEAVTISWDDGHTAPKFAIARGRDISAHGVSLRVNQPLPVRSYVTLHSEALNLAGTATVRYCRHGNGWYDVGLEFSGGLIYKLSGKPLSDTVLLK